MSSNFYEEVHIRAIIEFGDLRVKTPFILSFGVKRQRGVASASFTASIKIHKTDLSALNNLGTEGTVITIKAGTDTVLRTIFTGYIHNFSIQPCWVDASYVIVNMAGKDLLCIMENQHVTRRAKAYAMERWGVINSVVRRNTNFEERFPSKQGAPARMLTDLDIIQQGGQIIVFAEDPNTPKTPNERWGYPSSELKLSTTVVNKSTKL